LLEARRHARRSGAFVLTTALIVACLAIARTMLRAAFLPVAGGSIAGPAELLPDSLLLTALSWIAIDTIERRRLSTPRAQLIVGDRAATLTTLTAYTAAGALAAGGLWAYERVLGGITSEAAQDLVSFSLHPFEAGRLGTAAALVLLHAAVVWGAAAILRLPAVLWRTSRRYHRRLIAALAARSVSGVVLLFAATGASVPLGPLALTVLAAGLGALLLSRPQAAARRSSQAARLGLFFLSLASAPLSLCIRRSMRLLRPRRNGSWHRSLRRRLKASAKICRSGVCRRRLRRFDATRIAGRVRHQFV
jgi:hypothetical protein